MRFTHFTPRTTIPSGEETSRLASPREPSSPTQLWKTANATQDLVSAAMNSQGAFDRLLNRLRHQFAISEMHPFRIYRTPWEITTSNSAYDWRTFRVRGGYNFSTTGTSAIVDGTDEVILAYDDVFQYQPDGTKITGSFDVVIPSGQSKYYFWVDLETNSVQRGADPTSSDAGTDWDSWPNMDGGHVLIGWVDTQTLLSQRIALVRQILRTDILGIGDPCTYG